MPAGDGAAGAVMKQCAEEFKTQEFWVLFLTTQDFRGRSEAALYGGDE